MYTEVFGKKKYELGDELLDQVFDYDEEFSKTIQ